MRPHTARTLFKYDRETGLFYYRPKKVPLRGRKYSLEAARKQEQALAYNRAKGGKMVKLHQLNGKSVYMYHKSEPWHAGKMAWLIVRGYWPKNIGYFDGNPKNLQFRNLFIPPADWSGTKSGLEMPDELPSHMFSASNPFGHFLYNGERGDKNANES